MPLLHGRVLATALLVGTLVGGCVASAEERYQEAVTLAKDAESIEDVDRFLTYFTKDSAEVLRGIAVNNKRVKRFKYLDDVRKILVEGDIVNREEIGATIVLDIESAKKKKLTVTMLQQQGQWVIDGLQLETFWKPFKKLGEVSDL